MPIWKRGSSASEFFFEVYTLACKHPERFGKVALIYEETATSGSTQVRQITHGCSTTEAFGIIEIGKSTLFKDTLSE